MFKSIKKLFGRSEKIKSKINEIPEAETLKGILKIAYFDEQSAGDFLNIINGGIVSNITQKSKEDGHSYSAEAGIESPKINIPLNIINVNLPFSAGFKAKKQHETKELIQTQIQSTILTEFLKNYKDKGVLTFENPQLEISESSFIYMKTVAPITKLVDSSSKGFDFSKFDELLSELKGYYEMTASINNKKYIFRFNSKSLRNNYKLTDLKDMDLTFYGVKVGKSTIEKTSFANFANQFPKK